MKNIQQQHKNMKLTSLAGIALTLAFSFTIVPEARSQDELENMLTRRQISCQDISLNSSEYIPWYHQEGLMDSALLVLSYWGEKCGSTEPVTRTNTLLSLELHYFDESLLDQNFLRYMRAFDSRMDLIRGENTHVYNYYQSSFDYVPVGGKLDKWTMDLASAIKADYEPGSLEYLLCLFYSGQTDTVFQLLTTSPYRETVPGKHYNEELSNVLNLPSLSLSFYGGTWIPTGPLASMGVHPELGMTYGLKMKENLYELVLGVKFIKTPESYLARKEKNGPQELTNDFTGGYIAVEYTRDLLSNLRFTPFFTAGAGYDGFTMFNTDGNDEEETASANSYNFSIGGGYRFPVAKSSYLAVQARYNMVDYTLNKLFDKKGHVVSIRLSFGMFQNQYRDRQLQQLNYQGSRK